MNTQGKKLTPLQLREEMARRGLTQSLFAQRLGVSQSLVSLWLSGKSPIPTRRVEIALATFDAENPCPGPAVQRARRLMVQAGRLLRTT